MLKLYSEDPVREVSRTQFMEWMADSTVKIDSISLRSIADGIEIFGKRRLALNEKPKPVKPSLFGKEAVPSNTELFRSYMLYVPDSVVTQWERNGKTVRIMHDDSTWLNHLFAFLPLILIIVLFWVIMARQAGGMGGRGLFSFGRSKAILINNDKNKTTFKDVAGCDEAKADLEELVSFLKDPKKFDKLGGRIPKGVLLVGPPGTGKTLLARAVAGEAGVNFYSMSGSDFVEMFVGVGASRVRDLFETGKKNAPCILFIDEIDAVGRQRGAGLGGGHDEREQTLNQLLVEMDGFAPNEGVILVAATNRPDVLDKALLRPGRFDRQVVVGLPDLVGREAILRVHLEKRKVPLDKEVIVKDIAKGTPGLAGADLENLVNEAALMAARFGNPTVTQLDFEEARDKLWMGAERKSLLMSEEDKRMVAYHEAGHALINLLCKNADPLHKLTIIPRGRALGVTLSLPENDKVSMSKEAAEDQIAILMAGRLAQIMVFDKQTTGASNDISRATELARKMVTEWGFCEKLGPIAYSKNNDEIFLGREISKPKEMSEKTAEMIDDAVNDIVLTQVNRVNEMLLENRDKLDSLSEALFEHEVLNREEIDKVMAGESLSSTQKSRQYQQRKERETQEQKKVEPPPEPGQEGSEENPPPEKGTQIDKEA
ncbi:MAG: ATP-dependent zinc metalloprotease FtsH [Fibromonadaceae bacterium]|nr:ATP-dependent zinc metalloprotease FtsH [Fibromonadaceae bacterium]